ncbi:hypothetical protein DFR71_5933 [Nocardia alba]|uniref:Uncharacterized protein n=1 Tax=Nocardia alba TaxID=225051 RepID=A0A4R1FPZ6_9NOCA|nr:hypothetical protein DFR71_5933 [Nocardia alba]
MPLLCCAERSASPPEHRTTGSPIMLEGFTQLFNNFYAFGGDFLSVAINLGL